MVVKQIGWFGQQEGEDKQEDEMQKTSQAYYHGEKQEKTFSKSQTGIYALQAYKALRPDS